MTVLERKLVQRRAVELAKRQGTWVEQFVVIATACQFTHDAKEQTALRSELVDRHGAQKGTVDFCFALAKTLAPIVEPTVKACGAPTRTCICSRLSWPGMP